MLKSTPCFSGFSRPVPKNCCYKNKECPVYPRTSIHNHYFNTLTVWLWYTVEGKLFVIPLFSLVPLKVSPHVTISLYLACIILAYIGHPWPILCLPSLATIGKQWPPLAYIIFAYIGHPWPILHLPTLATIGLYYIGLHWPILYWPTLATIGLYFIGLHWPPLACIYIQGQWSFSS